MRIIKNMNTLKAMQKRGLITFADQTGSKITGLYDNKLFTCYYVDDGKYKFEYNNKKYGIKYFSGCFNPYVVEFQS